MKWQEGAVFEVPYPFVLDDYNGPPDEGGYPPTVKSWRPGVKYEPISPEDSAAFAHGIGKQILTVVSIHKPGRFPSRVFYERQWEAPNGKRFGKSGCRIATAEKFHRLISGYSHEYTLEPLEQVSDISG